MNKLELNFSASTENIIVCRTLVSAFMLTIDSKQIDLNELKTVISEGVTNAIVHGYKRDASKSVRLLLHYDYGNIFMEIEDHGIGIEDIEQAKEPMFSGSDDDRSGLGFTIMEVFSDDFEVISEVGKGTLIRCSKKLVYENVKAS